MQKWTAKYLVDGWQQCYRWLSQWFFAAIGLWEGLLLALESQPEVKQALVEFLATHARTTPGGVTIALAAIGMILRLIKQHKPT